MDGSPASPSRTAPRSVSHSAVWNTAELASCSVSVTNVAYVRIAYAPAVAAAWYIEGATVPLPTSTISSCKTANIRPRSTSARAVSSTFHGRSIPRQFATSRVVVAIQSSIAVSSLASTAGYCVIRCRVANLPRILTVQDMAHVDPLYVSAFRARLMRTPSSGRSALLLAELDRLSADVSDAAACLLADAVSARIEGLTRDTLVEYVRRAPASVCVRAYRRTAPRWGIDATMLLSKFTIHDVLGLVASVRDTGGSPREYLYTTGLVHTGFLVAAGFERELPESMHRKYADEALFLLGAASYPNLLVREMTKVHIHPDPSPAYDLRLARWCLENPHHVEDTRRFSLALCSAPVVAELAYEGVVSFREVFQWIDPRRASTFDPQVMLAFTLPDSVPGARLLRSRLFSLLEHPSAYVLALSDESRRAVLAERYSDLPEDVLSLAVDLAPRWHRDLDDLMSAAARLASARGGVSRTRRKSP